LELPFLLSSLVKFVEGGWFPIAGGAALGLPMLGKKLLPNKPVALFVVIGGIAAGVTGQRLILVTAMIGRS
jgi:hypothetical protein